MENHSCLKPGWHWGTVGLELCRIEDNSVVIEWQYKNRQLAGGSRQRTRVHAFHEGGGVQFPPWLGSLSTELGVALNAT